MGDSGLPPPQYLDGDPGCFETCKDMNMVAEPGYVGVPGDDAAAEISARDKDTQPRERAACDRHVIRHVARNIETNEELSLIHI